MAPPSTTRAALADVTVDNADALDCGVCYNPLKPPIFQCKVGHVICSPCRDKLATAQRCHVCRTPTPTGYHRNHDMEKLLESIRVPCSNAAYGCVARPVYYNKDVHVRSCKHAPCHCPITACGFAGSTTTLLDHFLAVHRWPCTTELRTTWKPFGVCLHDCFNVASVLVGGTKYLFLLTVTRKQFGTQISVFSVHPPAPIIRLSSSPVPWTVGFKLRLKYSRDSYGIGDICRAHCQETRFKVDCTDLANGLPDSDDSCQFFLPKFVHPLDLDTITLEFDIVKVIPN